ncbi:MAG TPA: MFS transporter [Thermoplasmataceae archaeon]|nr:MFS transporter [Thermoplasmataceae archaeon]
MERNNRVWNADISIIALVRATRSFYFGFLSFLLPLYLRASGFSYVQVGLYAFIATASSSVLVLVSGFMGDLYSRKRMFLIMSSLSGFLVATLLLTTNYYVLLGSAVFGLSFSGIGGGAGGGPITPLITAMVADRVKSGRTRIYSMLTSVATFSAVAGGAYSTFISAVFTDFYRILFITALVLNIISIGFGAFIRDTQQKIQRSRAERRTQILPKKSAKKILMISSTGLAGSLGMGLVVPLISLYFQDRGLLAYQISATFTLSYIVSGIMVNFASLIEKALGTIRAVIAVRIAASLLLLIIPLFPVIISAAIYILRTALYTTGQPIRQKFSMTIFSPEERSRGSSITGVFRRLPYGVSTQIGGFLFAYGLVAFAFLSAGVISMIDPILYYVYFHNQTEVNAE